MEHTLARVRAPVALALVLLWASSMVERPPPPGRMRSIPTPPSRIPGFHFTNLCLGRLRLLAALAFQLPVRRLATHPVALGLQRLQQPVQKFLAVLRSRG